MYFNFTEVVNHHDSVYFQLIIIYSVKSYRQNKAPQAIAFLEKLFVAISINLIIVDNIYLLLKIRFHNEIC